MMCKCLGCETEHKSRRNKSKHDVQNVTRTRNRGRKNRRKDLKRQNSLHLISPFHRSMSVVRLELSRKNIDHTSLKVETLTFVDPKDERLFLLQWRWRIGKNIPWFSIGVIFFLSVKYFATLLRDDFKDDQIFFALFPMLLGVLPVVVLLFISIVMKRLLVEYYDIIVCIVLLCISVSISLQNHFVRLHSTHERDAPDCNAVFPSPYVKVMVWFAALGLQVRFRPAALFGVIACAVEIVTLQLGLHQLYTVQFLLSSIYSLLISLFYAVIHSYRVELSSRRNFLMVGTEWHEAQTKIDLINDKIVCGCLKFRDPLDEEKFKSYTRLKRTKYVRRKLVTSLIPGCIILIIFYVFRLGLKEYGTSDFYKTIRTYNCSNTNNTLSPLDCPFTDSLNEGYISTRELFFTRVTHLFYTYMPVVVCASICAILYTTKYKALYKERRKNSGRIAFILLIVVPVLFATSWVIAIALTTEIGEKQLLNKYIPLNNNTKYYTVNKWNDIVGSLLHKDVNENHEFFATVCYMYGVNQTNVCDFQVFEVLQNLCPGTSTISNYLVWVLQLMCLLLTPRAIPSLVSILLIAMMHFSLMFSLDKFYWTLLWRDLPLFAGAIVVMIQQGYTYQENYLARQVYENSSDKVNDGGKDDYTLPSISNIGAPLEIQNPMKKKKRDSIKVMLDVMQDV